MTKDEALRLAFEAMENMANIRDCQREKGYPLSDADKRMQKAITAIKATLEAKDEPVGTAGELFSNTALERLDLRPSTNIYITPPQRKPLTDEEIERIWESLPFCNGAWETFARAIEAAHGIKGEA